jgi:hypothetical protein
MHVARNPGADLALQFALGAERLQPSHIARQA